MTVNEITPEMNAAWRYEIQYGPEGEETYAWLYRGAEIVATMRTHHAMKVCAALAAAPQPVVEPVAVKPLEWVQTTETTQAAETILGYYHIDRRWAPPRDPIFYWKRSGDFLKPCGTEADAKAAAQADYETRIRSALVSAPPPTTATLEAEIERLKARRNLYKGKYRALLKLVSRTRNKLVHVTDHIEDEGDRAYFGSTNDADDLKSLYHEMMSWIWDATDETNRLKGDPYAVIRDQRTRIAELEAREKRMREALEPFSKFAGILFERNFNSADYVDHLDAADGGTVTLTAGHFFEARRAALAKEGE